MVIIRLMLKKNYYDKILDLSQEFFKEKFPFKYWKNRPCTCFLSGSQQRIIFLFLCQALKYWTFWPKIVLSVFIFFPCTSDRFYRTDHNHTSRSRFSSFRESLSSHCGASEFTQNNCPKNPPRYLSSELHEPECSWWGDAADPWTHHTCLFINDIHCCSCNWT